MRKVLKLIVMASKVRMRSVSRSPSTYSDGTGDFAPLGGRGAEDVAVGGGAGQMGEHLSPETAHRTEHVGFPEAHACVVDEQARVEIVGTVDGQIAQSYQLPGIGWGEAVHHRLNGHERVYGGHGVAGRDGLGPVDVGGGVYHLSL